MCFSASSSLLTFFIGVTGSLILIKYGNKKYKKENIVFGIFFIFIALIQLMDFCFWIDLKNKIGLNHYITLIGPILNVGQPLILYLIKYLFFKPKINLTILNTNTLYAYLNIGYLLYLLDVYSNFLQKSKLTTGTSHGHLLWPWIKFTNPYFYCITISLNFFYLTNFNYSFIAFIILFLLLILSWYYFNYNVGELWCFFGAFMPTIIWFIFNHK
jgi:hypothetical protein